MSAKQQEFNYKFIKENASAGSWRRGYEYHLKDMVFDSYPEKNFYMAKVKGNFQDHYNTDLIFKKNKVEARCNCPLKEEWCKHAVAVALKAIDEHAYEDWLETKFGMEFDFPDENTALTEAPQGNYIFHFNSKRKANFFSVLVRSRETGKVVRQIEPILRALIEAQKQNPDFELNNSQKVEVAIFQQLLTVSRQDKKAGWYDIPITKFGPMFTLLSKADEVLDEKTKERLKFTDEEWKLILNVNTGAQGTILLSLEWKRPDKDDVYPLEEVRYFSRHLKWGRYKNIIFPTNIAMSSIPQNILKSSFTDLKDADGGKFIYEELPKLQEIMDVEIADNISQLMLTERPPLNIVTMGIDYDQSLKASLEFEYDGVVVPYSKTTAEKSPYITIKKPGEDLVYWVKRNLKHEQEAYQMLLACRFVPMQTNNLALEKENAIDFYNYYIKQAGEEYPDYWYIGNNDPNKYPNTAARIVDADVYVPQPNVYPLFTTKSAGLIPSIKAKTKFLLFSYPQLDETLWKTLKENDDIVAILTSGHKNPVGEQRAFFHELLCRGLDTPVILQHNYTENDNEDLQIKAGADFGALLSDGFGDGVWLQNQGNISTEAEICCMYGILQAVRQRISKTEYISCPGCGRTLFDLQKTIAKVKAATSHLKGLKIGIMGCIVNGPGEMADADYGYVGAGRDRISLYKNKVCIEKNIPEEQAVEKLIELIKINGDWKDK